MSTENSFKAKLYEVAEKKATLIDTTVMPQMLDNYRSIHASLKGLINLLESKKLILPDPYKQETKLADIKIPETEGFSDLEGPTVFGIRISDYESSLDFLCNYGVFSLQALTPERIKVLFNFNMFIDWSSLNHIPTQPNSRYFSLILNSIKNGSDTMATGLLNNMISSVVRCFQEINTELKNLSNIQRELYKIEVRKNVLDSADVIEKYESSNEKDAMDVIKKEFASHMGQKKFYAPLIQDIIQEDFSLDKEKLQAAVLEIFFTETKKEEKLEKKIDTKAMILDVVKIMPSFSVSLVSIYKKIAENHELYQDEKKTVWDKFVNALRIAFGISPKPIEYSIKSVDMFTNTEKSEVINYYDFMKEFYNIGKNYGALGDPNSPILKKLEKEDEEDILLFVQKKLSMIQVLYATLVGFDNFFKTSVHQANRSKVKGLKMDLDVLKNNALKANKNKAEYVSTITFEKQMEKMGVIGD